MLIQGMMLLLMTDWPQWMGPNRDGHSTERALTRQWTEAGPKTLWKLPVGKGYSSTVIAKGRLYSMWEDEKDQVLYCLEAKTGKVLWHHPIEPIFKTIPRYGDGPRSTPVIDGDRIFGLSARGILFCVDRNTGKEIWRKSLHAEHGYKDQAGKPLDLSLTDSDENIGYVSSPLIDGDTLYLHFGSSNVIMAFDKQNGALKWHVHDGKSDFSSPLMWDLLGRRQLVSFVGTGLTGLDPGNGTVLWAFPWETKFDVNASLPVRVGENRILIASGYNKGAALVQVEKQGDTFKAEAVWESQLLRNHYQALIHHNGYIYGTDNAFLTCVRVADGEVMWKERGAGHSGSMIEADGMLIVLSDRGTLFLVDLDPKAYKLFAQAELLKGACLTPPALADGLLYLRNMEELLCLDMRQASYASQQ